jgi:hypothetical protein
MRLQLFSLVSSLLFFSTSVLADTAHINYVSSTSDQYTQLKSELEDLGYTVTGTNSGSVSLNDFSSKDLHINISGDSNCGNSCKTAYETYIGNGGNVIIAGNGVYNNNRTGSIEALIESKLSVGQITLLNYNANFVAYANGSYSGDATSGYWVTRNLFSMQSGGTALGSNNSTGTHSQKSWAKYDYGSNGGQLFVTFDQAQFKNSNSTYLTRFYAYLQQTLTNEGILLTTSTSGITSNQTTEFNAARNKSISGNQLYITQTGNNNTLNILQDGDDNLIIGTDLTSAAVINGDNNNVDIDQLGSDNVLGLDIVGSSNDVDVIQNQDQRAKLNITGSSNTANLNQSAINNVGEHYMSVIINGSNNTLDLDQTETGNKKLWLDIDSSNNVAVDQKGTGNHFLDITLTDSHSVDVTQDGSGNHNATVNLSGNSSSVNLTQDSSTDQNYYLEQNCTNTSCSATVTQN